MFGEQPSRFHEAAYNGAERRSESEGPDFGTWTHEPHLLVVATHTAAGVALIVVLEFLIHPTFNSAFHAEAGRRIPGPDVFPNRGDVRIGKKVLVTVRVVFKHATFRPRFRHSGQAVVPRLQQTKKSESYVKMELKTV